MLFKCNYIMHAKFASWLRCMHFSSHCYPNILFILQNAGILSVVVFCSLYTEYPVQYADLFVSFTVLAPCRACRAHRNYFCADFISS